MPTYNTQVNQLFPGAGELNNLWMQVIEEVPEMTPAQLDAAWLEADDKTITAIAAKIETACYAVEDGTIEVIPVTDAGVPSAIPIGPAGVRFVANGVAYRARVVQWVLRGYSGSI